LNGENSTDNLYCSIGQDFYAGLCCDNEMNFLTGCRTFMPKSGFCSKASDSSFYSIKRYGNCPFDRYKCGSPSRVLRSDFREKTIYTSPDFGQTDVCPYVLMAESVIQFDISIDITITHVNKAVLYVLLGDSINNITSVKKLDNEGGTLKLPLSEYGAYHLLVVPLNISYSDNDYSPPSLSFSFKNIEEMTSSELITTYTQYIVGVLLFICLSGILMTSMAFDSEFEDV